jgi:DNA-binding NtrC family response regulator
MKIIKTLVIDDEISILRSLEMLLSKEGHQVTTANRGDIGLSLATEGSFDVVFTDLRLPDMSGLDIISQVKKKAPSTQIILITGFASIETAVEAIKLGAYDYLTKPLSTDKVRITVKRALEKAALTEEVAHLRQELSQCFGFENLIGKSPLMQNIFKIIRQTAGSDSNVLATGESGQSKRVQATTTTPHARTIVLCPSTGGFGTYRGELGYVRGACQGTK